MKKPNLFIVGAAKAGTTSLHRYLESHPEVFMCPIKEPNFFAKDIFPSKFIKPFRRIYNINLTKLSNSNFRLNVAYAKSLKEYLMLFHDVKNEKIVGESGVLYFWSKKAPAEIKKFNPEAKIIIMLRNPISRAYSHYFMDYKDKVTDKTFLEEIKKFDEKSIWGTRSLCINFSFYYTPLKRYFKLFPQENIKIIYFEEFISDPAKILLDVYKFLGISKDFVPSTLEKHNYGRVPRNKIFRFFIGTNLHKVYDKLKIPKVFDDFIKKIWFRKRKEKMNEHAKKLLLKILKKDIVKTSNLLNGLD